jgi:hypothetical protein
MTPWKIFNNRPLLLALPMLWEQQKRQRTEQERQLAEQERQRADALAAKLRELNAE